MVAMVVGQCSFGSPSMSSDRGLFSSYVYSITHLSPTSMNEVVRTPVPSDSLEVVKYLRRQIASFSELPKPVQRSCAVRLVQVCHAGRWSVSRCVERRCPKPGATSLLCASTRRPSALQIQPSSGRTGPVAKRLTLYKNRWRKL